MEGPGGLTDRGGGCLVIGNDGGGGKEMVRSYMTCINSQARGSKYLWVIQLFSNDLFVARTSLVLCVLHFLSHRPLLYC